MLEQTKNQLITLRLQGMLQALEEQLQTSCHHLSFEERFSMLVERECLQRDNQKLVNRLKQAKLKPGCSFEQIDFQHMRGIHKPQILSLGNMAWVQQHRAIIITGPTGTGKTFLACAFAHKACLQGFSARYYRLLHLLHDTTIAYREGKLPRFLETLSKVNILIVDDFGMMPMDNEQKRLLLEILEHRYEQNSTLLTSQLPVQQWYEYLNDPLIADALLDRIVHQAEKISLTGESMRKMKTKITEQEEEKK